MQTRYIWVALLLTGCDGAAPVVGVPAAPGADCTFDPETSGGGERLVMDVARSPRFQVPLAIDNPSGQPLEAYEGDVRFECRDAEARMHVPALGTGQAFCQGPDGAGDFIGFDIMTASSAPIPAGARGIAYLEIVPGQYGEAFDDMFDAARLADACVAAVSPVDFDNPACAPLLDLEPRPSLGDIEPLAALARYDGRYYDDVIAPREGTSTTAANREAYPMTVRGILRLRGADGDELTTDEFAIDVALCRHCGAPTAAGRTARGGYACYHP